VLDASPAGHPRQRPFGVRFTGFGIGRQLMAGRGVRQGFPVMAMLIGVECGDGVGGGGCRGSFLLRAPAAKAWPGNAVAGHGLMGLARPAPRSGDIIRPATENSRVNRKTCPYRRASARPAVAGVVPVGQSRRRCG